MSQENKLSEIQKTAEIIVDNRKSYELDYSPVDLIDDREPDDGIPYQFTIRGVIVGSLLGSVIAASNMYMGLKAGMVFSASIFGAILSFTIIKPMERLPLYLGGGEFGIKENCTAQTAASAAGGLTAGFITAIPALFRFNILTNIDGIWDMMFLWTLAAAFYGLFFAIPLRKHFIINQNLAFPNSLATAVTIRALHSAAKSNNQEDSVANNTSKVIIWSFLGSFVYKIAGFFVPFIIDLHPLYWIGNAVNSKVLIDIDTTWLWHVELTTAIIGSGMLMGTNAVLSITAGNIFAWAIMSPVLFFHTEGIVNHDSPWSFKIGNNGTITSQMWLLWPGIVIMICASFTELFCQYRSLINGFKGIYISIYNIFAKLFGKPQKQLGSNNSLDPVPDNEQIPGWQWSTGIVVSVIFTILILNFYFSIQWYLGLLAIILGFLLSFVATQCFGETNLNPMGNIGKTTQFIFAPIKQASVTLDLQANLIAGNVAAACAAQTVDMVADLKTGHLLRASPKSQFYSQIIGSLFGVVVAVVVFWVFGKAYPCILVNTDGSNSCPFSAPSVLAWYGVSLALTTDITKSIPASCQIACLVFGLISIVSTVLKRTYLKKYADWIPNWMAFGIALTFPTPFLLLAMLYGLCIEQIWKKLNPKQHENYKEALSSGLIAGEGIGGVIYAIFQLSGIDQSRVATKFACPPKGC
jgi:OPT family oligopeptide transporter